MLARFVVQQHMLRKSNIRVMIQSSFSHSFKHQLHFLIAFELKLHHLPRQFSHLLGLEESLEGTHIIVCVSFSIIHKGSLNLSQVEFSVVVQVSCVEFSLELSCHFWGNLESMLLGIFCEELLSLILCDSSAISKLFSSPCLNIILEFIIRARIGFIIRFTIRAITTTKGSLNLLKVKNTIMVGISHIETCIKLILHCWGEFNSMIFGIL